MANLLSLTPGFIPVDATVSAKNRFNGFPGVFVFPPD